MENENNISSKLAVKFMLPPLGMDHDKSHLLDSVSEYMKLNHVLAANLTEDVFIVYVDNLASFRHLLIHPIRYRDQKIMAYPILNIFAIKDIVPSIKDSAIIEVLKPYGDIEEIETLPFCGNNPMYNHILGAERRVFIHVPLRSTSVHLPRNIPIAYFNIREKNYHVQKCCFLCKGNGHFTLECSSLPRVDSTSCLSSSSTRPVFVLKDVQRPPSMNHASADGESKRDEDNASPIEIPSDTFRYLQCSIKGETVQDAAPVVVDDTISSRRKTKVKRAQTCSPDFQASEIQKRKRCRPGPKCSKT